ncbi:MAG: putative porin [Leptospirales bacterium]|nr:putative porin [Leptospirales bacterium]
MKHCLALAVVLPSLPLQAVEFSSSLGFYRAWNQGNTIFEIGSRQPDITGVAGGSRITYPRNFAYTGASLSVYASSLALDLELAGTGPHVRSGTGRDEDFFLNSFSREEGAKISLREGKFSDRAYVFSGGRNWADSYGKTDLYEYRARLAAKFYRTGMADPFLRDGGLYLSTAFAYSYSKYTIYDVIQYNQVSLIRPSPLSFSILPIGTGLTFTNVANELSVGLGYMTYMSESLGLDLGFAPLVGVEKSRDHHVLRGLTFIMENGGAGFLYNADLLFLVREGMLIRTGLTGHRLYARGNIRAYGLDLVYNFLPKQRMYLNTKEWGARLSAEFRL